MKLEKVENINTIEKLKKRVTELEKLATVEKDVEELDLSNKCGHEPEDGYQLDAHHWSEHDDGDDPIFFNCQQCVERFSTLKDLMAHKKNKHSDIQYVGTIQMVFVLLGKPVGSNMRIRKVKMSQTHKQ